MIYFLIAIVSLGTIFNFIKRRKNIISVKATRLEKISTLVSLALSLVICYKFNNTIVGYLLVLLFILFFYSAIICQGLGERGFIIKVGANLFLAFYTFERLRQVRIREERDYLELSIYTFSGEYKHLYNKESANIIYKLLEENKVKISYE